MKEAMARSKVILLSITALFLMLWAPLGQYEFLIENWMKLGTYVVPFILISFLAAKTEPVTKSFSNRSLISILLLTAYMIHQFEEHWIDIFGNQYAFYGYLNNLLRSALGSTDPGVIIATPAAIFVINTSLVWLIGLIALWRSPVHLFPVLAMNGIVLINAVSHILSGISKVSYNPGLLTAISIFLPLSIAVYRDILRKYPEVKLQAIASVVWAILAHVILIAGLLAANWFHWISEPVYFGILVIWSVLPAFLFTTPLPKFREQRQ
ncbi:MAG: HXXEE domain-containing protein [Cyanobacteria bacterium P01_F01_bin.153]